MEEDFGPALNDEAKRHLAEIKLANHVDVVRDGQQALDYLFREGEFTGRGGQAEPMEPMVARLGIYSLSTNEPPNK